MDTKAPVKKGSCCCLHHVNVKCHFTDVTRNCTCSGTRCLNSWCSWWPRCQEDKPCPPKSTTFQESFQALCQKIALFWCDRFWIFASLFSLFVWLLLSAPSSLGLCFVVLSCGSCDKLKVIRRLLLLPQLLFHRHLSTCVLAMLIITWRDVGSGNQGMTTATWWF